ncbi:MAG TPA: hypothetical protein PKE38_10610 [Ignavibacteriaceae bacterium]|nr:hypothetical protein [Ignavibacteriaceae bacterium]
MNIFKYFLFLPILIVFYSCHSDLVTQKYETTILKNAVSFSIPQFQNNEEIELIKKHKVKSISYILVNSDSTKIDSLTYVEFDLDGKILRRTTKENTTQGCLPYMMRQEFNYDGKRIKKVTDYTFKYVVNSVLENWLQRDTTLEMFDWEDYTYKGDTIIVESGASIQTFFKDQKGNVIKRTTLTKTDKKLHIHEYEFNDGSVVAKFYSPSYDDIQIMNYFIDKNFVRESYSTKDKKYKEELIFDTDCLLKTRIQYLNDEPTSKTIVTYSYY